MDQIIISTPEVSGNKARIPIETRGLPDRFICDDYLVTYSEPIDNVPDPILVIPAITNLLPIAWATDAQLITEQVDSQFMASVDDVRQNFDTLYPELAASERMLTANDLVQLEVTGERSMALFSGGVDSTTTYIRNRDKEPILTSIHGADIGRDETKVWKDVYSSLSQFANKVDVPLVTLSSNMKEMLEYPMVASYYDDYHVGGWWGGVQHGLALLGACAPLTYKLGVDQLYIASTHTEEFTRPWGSHPKIDNNISWGSTQAYHDGYELTRQEKIERIVKYADDTGYQPYVRSCLNSENGENCGRCEKCCRTITGILIAGDNPENYGYPISEDTFSWTREALESGKWSIGYDEQYMWEDLQNNLPAKDTPQFSNVGSFFRWLDSTNINDLKENSSSNPSFPERITPFVKYLPDPFYRLLINTKRTII